MPDTRYDVIGAQNAATRREDPRIAALIHAALGGARSIVNVGAGGGSYEPHDRRSLAIEPSEVMIAQRDPRLPPAIVGGAYPLHLEDRSMDVAMAILTIHHWDDDQERGVREMRRVARGPVVILTFDPEVSARMWLMADYFPEVTELDRRTLPRPQTVARQDRTWDARHGHLRELEEYDAGLRLLVSSPHSRASRSRAARVDAPFARPR